MTRNVNLTTYFQTKKKKNLNCFILASYFQIWVLLCTKTLFRDLEHLVSCKLNVQDNCENTPIKFIANEILRRHLFYHPKLSLRNCLQNIGKFAV